MRRRLRQAAGRAAPGPLSYGRAGALGVLWGLPVAMAQFGATPAFGAFVLLIVPLWCATGLILAWSEMWLAQRFHPLLSAPLALLAATAGHEAIVMINSDHMAKVLGHPPLASSIFFFALWNILCLGGLLLAALAMARREARTALVVASGEIARHHDDARLSHVDLQDLRGQISPGLLIAAVSELGRRYALDGERGERLLDKLVAFLRAAMPSVRTGRSTVAAELETVKAYAGLLAELDPARGAWRIRMDAGRGDARFPPMLLLPALETISGADPASPLEIEVKRAKGSVTLEASGPARFDGPRARDLERRLREGLRHGIGERASVSLEPSPNLALAITMPADVAPSRDRGGPGRLPIPQQLI